MLAGRPRFVFKIKMETIGAKIIRFYRELHVGIPLPAGVEVLNPHHDPAVQKITTEFFTRFYNDNKPRKLIMGINPGRHGAGITGINFTAPRQLKENCGIEHSFGNSSELSAEFIYQVIEAYGGAAKFYNDYFISAMSPLGYTKNGKNLNYYDDRSLELLLTPFIEDCLDRQFKMGFDTSRCICIGMDKNLRFLSSLNEKRQKMGLSCFESIAAVPHPRFILQYRRKQLQTFITLYLEVLKTPGW